MNNFQKIENNLNIINRKLQRSNLYEKRGKNMREFFGNEKYRKIILAFWITLMVAIITFVILFVTFSKRLKDTSDIGLLSLNTVNNVVPNNADSSAVSTTEDKNINQVANEILNNLDTNTVISSGETGNVSAKQEVVENEAQVEIPKEEKIEDEKKEETPISFIAPVSGDILTDYAKDSLVYSNTLEEWSTHLGIDIKANKASSVVASESGTIKSIKNDPRYGLTITMSHRDGFETVYSNLLGAEFVNEGDTIEKGQTIGTVGESASFEIAEVPHLHFEIYKDGESVNPTEYLK